MQRMRFAALAALVTGCTCGESLPCRTEARGDGRSYLVCPDGSETPLPGDRQPVPRGDVIGTARRFGKPGPGIRVATSATVAEGTRVFEAFTDGEGRFRLEGLPPGHRALSFSAPGYVEEVRSALVLPGTLELPEPVTLWRGQLVEAGVLGVEALPDGRHFLSLEGSELAIWDGREGGRFSLHGRCEAYRVEGGRYVFYSGQDDPLRAPALYRFDVSTGERLRLFEEAWSFQVAPGGVAVAAQVPVAEGGDQLRVWDAATGTVATPAEQVSAFQFGPEGRRLVLGTGTVTVLWDVAAVAGTVVGGRFGGVTWGPTDDTLSLDGVVYDVARERSWPLAPGGPATFSADGRFAVQRSGNRLDLLDLETGFRETVPSDGEWTFDGAGGLFLIRLDGPGARSLVRRELATGATVELAAGAQFFGLAPLADGALLYRRVIGTVWSAEAWHPARGGELLEPAGAGGGPRCSVSPDGAVVLHGDGVRLNRYEVSTGADAELADDVSLYPLGPWHPWWGPGGRFALAAGGELAVWDPAGGRRARGPGPGPAEISTFRADGSFLALRHHTGGAGQLLQATDGALRVLAEGVTWLEAQERGVGFHAVGKPYLYPAVFHRLDLATGAVEPLEAEVSQPIFGDGFLAYTVNPYTEDNPRRAGLYLIRDPETRPEGR